MTPIACLANARLVLGDEIRRGGLVLKHGRIAEILGAGAVPAGAVDCEGDLIAPGLIELHTDNLERHLAPRPKVAWPHRAAILAHDAELAGCGITTVFDALRVGSVESRKDGLRRYARPLATEILALRGADALKIGHFLHLRAEVCSETLTGELDEFGPEDRVGIVSLMDHVPGQRQFRDIGKYREYIAGRRGLGAAELDAHVGFLAELHARVARQHEAASVAAARRCGAVIASHDDTTAEQVATSAGLGVSLAEFPTTREAASACRAAGIAVMMGAPNLVRGRSHSGNVAATELAGQGMLDILSSDYVPSALFTAAVQLGQIWGNLAAGLRSVTEAPARAARLDDRGRIAAGLRADLIRVAERPDGLRLRAVLVGARQVA